MCAKIRKAVIPVAGLGTRFLPVTRVVPKELLPIVTTPTLQIVVDEAVRSGIEEIILVTSPLKGDITRYLSLEIAYDHKLEGHGKLGLLDSLKKILKNISIKTVVQEKAIGLGHAVLCAKGAVGNEPFVVILPDVLIESEIPCCRQIIDVFEKTGSAVSATEHSPRDKLHLYGIYDIESSDGRCHKAKGVVEKPPPGKAPSDLSVVGRYLFLPDVFSILENTKPGRNGEIQLADAMDTLAKMGKMFAFEYEGRQFDTGDPAGFLKANVFYGMKLMGKELLPFIREIARG